MCLLFITKISYKVFSYLHNFNIDLKLKWCSTHVQKADEPSRTVTKTECRLRYCFRPLIKRFCTLDCFAVPINKVCDRYISRFDYLDQVAKDALTYKPRSIDYLWLYPPQPLIVPTIRVLSVFNVKSIFLHHVFTDTTLQTSALMEAYEYRIIVGRRGFPFCDAPCNSKDKQRLGHTYFRRYTDPSETYLYFKGYTLDEIKSFVTQLRSFRDEPCLAKRMGRIWRYKTFIKLHEQRPLKLR